MITLQAAGRPDPAVHGQDMVAALVGMSLQTYSQVRGVAQATLAAVLKRHPSLAPGVLPTYLGVLSGLASPGPAEAWQDSEAALQRCVEGAVPAMARGSRQQQDISPAGEPGLLAAQASQAAEHTLRGAVVRAGLLQRVLGLRGCPAGLDRPAAACAGRPSLLLQQAAAPCTAGCHACQLASASTSPCQACRLRTPRHAQGALLCAEAGAGTARLEGAYQALNSMPLYRLVSRSSSALAGLMAAIMASLSGAQASPQAHDIISRLFAQLVMKYIPPPELRYLQVRSPCSHKCSPVLRCIRASGEVLRQRQ